MYNLGQFVQYCRKPCTISLSNPFFSCTTFQVVYGVQPFVQYCTTYVQRCTKLYRLYRLYNLLYNIVTVWFADECALQTFSHAAVTDSESIRSLTDGIRVCKPLANRYNIVQKVVQPVQPVQYCTTLYISCTILYKRLYSRAINHLEKRHEGLSRDIPG